MPPPAKPSHHHLQHEVHHNNGLYEPLVYSCAAALSHLQRCCKTLPILPAIPTVASIDPVGLKDQLAQRPGAVIAARRCSIDYIC